MPESLRLADLLAALSVTTDLAMGQEPEKAIRAAVVSVEMADHLGLAEDDAVDVYYTTLLRHLGCTATAHEEADLYGPDERVFRRVAERTDDANPREVLAMFGTVGRGSGAGRLGFVARAIAAGSDPGRRIMTAICEVATRLAARLGLGEGVERGLYESLERWDGKGVPQGLVGEDVAIAARIAEPATQAVIFHRLGGPEAVLAMAERRRGGMFDPAAVDALRAVGPAVLTRLDDEDPWAAVLEAEPGRPRTIPPDRIGRLGEAFADMIDLKSSYTAGHSAAVAALASSAAARLGIDDPERVRVAALFHDLGRSAVGNGVWEKAATLTTSEWEQVRLHPYHSERILARSAALEPIAKIAGMHHERLDGSGYHRGAGAEAPGAARVLAVADAYQSWTQARPHRPALSPAQAADRLTDEVKDGRFDPECATAVLEAAGQEMGRPRSAWPAGLSEREVEVLRLLSRGSSNKQIAAALVISPRTAEHHVQHIYGKIGASTRAAATLFAMEHGLLR